MYIASIRVFFSFFFCDTRIFRALKSVIRFVMCTARMKGLRDKSLMKNFKGIILFEIRVLVLVSLEMGISEVCGARSG